MAVVSLVMGLGLLVPAAQASGGANEAPAMGTARPAVDDPALQAALLISRRDAPLRLVVPLSSALKLAGEGFVIGEAIGSLPFTRALATPLEVEAAAQVGLAQGVVLDRLIPHPMPAAGASPRDTTDIDWAGVTGAKALQTRGFTGRGTAIAVIDSGIQASHPYFRGSDGRSRIVAESCFVSTWFRPEFPCPGGGDQAVGAGAADTGSRTESPWPHGTHVAGIAAGNAAQAPGAKGFTGMAPDANLVISRVFGSGGASSSDISQALDWVAGLAGTHNISAVNLSLGSPPMRYFDCAAFGDSMFSAVTTRLRTAGVAIVASSGNGSNPIFIGSPACTTGWVSVGATDWLGRVAFFSNVSEDIDIMAPGQNLWSSVPVNEFASYAGTSMASPVVAGAFGLMRQAVPGTSADAVLTAIRTTGPRIDDVFVKQLPTLRIDRAHSILTDPNYPAFATDVRVSTTATSATVMWGVAPSGARPTSYVVSLGRRSVTTTGTSHTFEGLTGSDYAVSVTPKVGDTDGIATPGPVAFRIDPGLAEVVTEVGTGYAADFCPGGDLAASLAYPKPPPEWDRGTKQIRVLAGPLGESATEYVRAGDEAVYRFVIAEAEIADSSVIELQRIHDDAVSPSQRITDLFDLIPGGLAAKPGRLSARVGEGSVMLTWQPRDAKEWRVLVDGEVAQATTEPRVTLNLMEGDHDITVCAVGTNGSTSRAARLSVDVPAPTPVPGAPASLQVSKSGSSVTASWSAPAGPVVIYTVEARYGSTWRVVGTSRSASFRIASASLGSASQMRVAAVNVAGRGAWSAAASIPRR